MLIKINKEDLIKSICFTELVYGRINKKLNLKLSNPAIEALIIDLLFETDEQYFKRIGKNIYHKRPK